MTKKTSSHFTSLSNWLPKLSNSLTESPDKKYRHHVLKEDLNYRNDIIPQLQSVITEAHKDANNHLKDLKVDSLDPLNEFNFTENTSSSDKYPHDLNLTTLKGYFGEIFAGIIAENFDSHGERNWEVPAFPFRFHNVAFEQLEMIVQTEEEAGIIPGRTGDDCLAFLRNDQGEITKSLICEAKCTSTHQTKMIREAHKKQNTSNPKPVIIGQLIDILKSSTNSDSKQWINSLTELLLNNNPLNGYERCDLVSYICGLPPVKASTVIIPKDKPHSEYKENRRLEAVEIHLHDVDGLIADVYNKQEYFQAKNYSEFDLLSTWSEILNSITPPTAKALLRQRCELIVVNNEEIIISVDTINNFRALQRKRENIKKAFIKSGIYSQNNIPKIKIITGKSTQANYLQNRTNLNNIGQDFSKTKPSQNVVQTVSLNRRFKTFKRGESSEDETEKE